MFNLYGTERLAEWKKFRDTLEQADNPFLLCAKFWSRAPFVNHFLNPLLPVSWPSPWKLILDDHFDDLAIALGMLYTLQLTKRFMDEKFEIYMSISTQPNDNEFYLVVGDENVMNLEYGNVVHVDNLKGKNTCRIYPVINI